MALAPEHSLSDAASSLGRSSSIDARDGALARSDSQHRSANKLVRKGGLSSNDLFVCFAPRTTLNLASSNRSVVSPGRDKSKEPGSARRGSRTASASIFSSKAPSKKQGYDVAEEPTSPKVTCIGQVRSKSKKGKKHKVGAAAPRKQGSTAVHADKKEPSACPSFAKDFSCFGLPCDSYGSFPSFRGNKKSGGTVLAKSLVLIQREDEGKMMVAVEALATHQQSLPETKNGGEASAVGKCGLREEEIYTEKLPALEETMFMMGATDAEAFQNKENADNQTSLAEDDTFEVEPPLEEDDTFEVEPSPAVLLMRTKVERLRVLVPPPSTNITLKRSTSAPMHSSRKSEDGDGVRQAPDCADHTSALDAKQEPSSALISSEDLPRPTISFLQRCKSVSRSLSRSSSGRVDETKSSVGTLEVRAAGEDEARVETRVPDEHNDELHLVSEALSRRTDSEALRVSLDIVPETWLWEARAIARKDLKETTGSGRRLEKKQVGGPVVEWLDGELEAALWKSCQVSDGAPPLPHTRGSDTSYTMEPLLVDSIANQSLDAEVEATLWRCCSLVASHQSSQDLQSQPKTADVRLESTTESKIDGACMKIVGQSKTEEENLEESAKQPTIKDKNASKQTSNAAHSNNLGRSSSVGSQCGKHLLERGSSLRRSASVGAGHKHFHQQEKARNERRKSTEQSKTERIITNEKSPHETAAEGHVQIDDAHIGIATSERYATTCIVEAELWCAGAGPPYGHSHKDTSHNDLWIADCKDAGEEVKHTSKEEAMDAEGIAPSSLPSVLDQPVPPPSPTLATPPEAVLFVRYDIGAFRIAVDAPSKMEEQGPDHDHHHRHHQQQKAMLEAISHLHMHDVQRTYACLLKAASGKERTSLSSATFSLQRCKSEPVRLASY